MPDAIHVLVVDDDPEVRSLLTMVLAGQAHGQTADALTCGTLKGESARTASASQWTISGPSGKTTETGVLRSGPRFECVAGAILVMEFTSSAGHSVFEAYFPDGTDIAYGTVDVAVTDGFTGNLALKTAEGLARFFANEIKTTLTSTPLAMLGAAIASGALNKMRQRLDPGRVNGGPLLGLNGIVVKSHGGADAGGFASAIRVATNLARSDFRAEIDRNLKRLTAAAAKDEASGAGQDQGAAE